MRPSVIAPSLILAVVTGCSSSPSDGSGGASVSSTIATASSSGGGGAGGTGAGGDATTCDDIGACGTQTDPACIGCALHGACADQSNACASVPCTQLEDCYVDCDITMAGDPCFMACDQKYPDAVMPYGLLAFCVCCGQCPVSCAVKSTDCQ